MEAAARTKEAKQQEARLAVNVAERRMMQLKSAAVRPGQSYAAAAAAAAGNAAAPRLETAPAGPGDLMGMNISKVNAKIQHEVQLFKRKGGVIASRADKDALIISILASIQIDALFNDV